MKNKKTISFLIFVVLLTTAGYFWIQYKDAHPSTSDAYVHGNNVYISPQVNGRLIGVYTDSFEKVRKGQLLVEIDPTSYELAVQKATTELNSAKADLEYSKAELISVQEQAESAKVELEHAKSTYNRYKTIYKTKMLSKQKIDNLLDNYKQALSKYRAANATVGAAGADIVKVKAKIEKAKVVLKQAKLNLSYTKIYAPSDGITNKVDIQRGQFASTGDKLFALVESNQMWIDANFKETDLNAIKEGMYAEVSIDMYPGIKYKGFVQSVSPASGTVFSLIPPQNATGNWVKVTQRFPVKIALSDLNQTQKTDHPLRLGSSVSVTIDTHKFTK